MPFAITEPLRLTSDTLGQSWLGDEIENNIALCQYQTIDEVFNRYLQKGFNVLEAGCGLGRWVFHLNRKGMNAEGVDASATAIEAVLKYDSAAPVRLGDVTALPYSDLEFDAVISLGVVEHFPDGPEPVLKEMRRVLKSEGILFLSIPPETTIRALIVHPMHRLRRFSWRIRKIASAFAEFRYRESAMRKILQKAGFDIIDTVTDELQIPRSIGLYTDFPRLRDSGGNWKLNRLGIVIRQLLDGLSPRLSRGGVLFVCRKKRG